MTRPILDYGAVSYSMARWKLVLLLALILGLGTAVGYWRARTSRPFAAALPAQIQQSIRAFQDYERATKEAGSLAGTDPAKARQVLHQAIAQATTQGIVPGDLRFFPTPGEYLLLRLYLMDPPTEGAALFLKQKEEYLAYIKATYPSYNLEAELGFAQLKRRRSTTSSSGGAPDSVNRKRQDEKTGGRENGSGINITKPVADEQAI